MFPILKPSISINRVKIRENEFIIILLYNNQAVASLYGKLYKKNSLFSVEDMFQQNKSFSKIK